MIELLEVKNYDKHHHYGTDWVTEFILKSDEELTLDKAFEWLKDNNYSPYGACEFKKIDDNKYLYKTVMY